MSRLERAVDAIKKAIDDATLGLSADEVEAVLDETLSDIEARRAELKEAPEPK